MAGEKYNHIDVSKFFTSRPYKIPRRKITKKSYTPKDYRKHGTDLNNSLNEVLNIPNVEDWGIYLTITGDERFLEQAKSLEDNGKNNIKISRFKINEDSSIAVSMFVNKKHINKLLNKISDYLSKKTSKGNPKSQPLMDSIDKIQTAVLEELWDGDIEAIPSQLKKWCEIWIMERDPQNFFALCDELKIRHSNRKNVIKFIDRTVIKIEVNKDDLNNLLNKYAFIGEFKPINNLTGFWVTMSPSEQQEWIENLKNRTSIQNTSNIAISLLDTGVNNTHPLLQNIIKDNELDTVLPNSNVNDNDNHGTGMCGILAYGDIQKCLENSNPITVNHQISSIKIVDKTLKENDPLLYGSVTEQGVYQAQIIHPKSNIMYCMAITEEGLNLDGHPSSWSAAIDQITSGQDIEDYKNQGNSRLFFISAGNSYYDNSEEYPKANLYNSIESPGQAWNSITVGAYTNKDELGSYVPLATKGQISPYTKTSLNWIKSQWSIIKPEILFEGGNKVKDLTGCSQSIDSSILTLDSNPLQNGNFDVITGTSPATAQATNFAAKIRDLYPNYRMETIRALMIHSAEWTEAMLKQFYKNTGKKSDYARIFRICGYGVPNLEKAIHSASNSLVLIAENEIQPYRLKEDGSSTATNEMHIYELPWPKEELEKLSNTPVKLKVTLSYFIEPSPIGCNVSSKYRYASHGLRFDLNRATEKLDDFIAKICDYEKQEAKEKGISISDRPESPWKYSDECGINNGSIHSNVWEGTAADLAESNHLIIYPIIGWWKERKNLECYNKKTRYSLIVSLETPSIETDIYTPVLNKVKISLPQSITT